MIILKRFTDEQLGRASNIDLVNMLKGQGEKLKKEGRVHRWMRYDSTVIYGNKWFRHSRSVGGGPIQFMQHFYGMDFVESVKYLLNGEEGAVFTQAEQQNYEKPEFIVPKLSKNMHRTFAYLIQTRMIDADIVQHFVNEKKIQETEKYHNAAFCGYDEQGEMKQMHLRSTIPGSRFFQDIDGSDKQYCFRHEGSGSDVYVFEAPIDMLSYITMHKDDWQEQSYVCLGGVAIDALKNIMKNNENIERVHLCVDKDEAGDKTVKRIGDELTENGIEWDRIIPENKDWNEDLIQLREQENTQSFELRM
ncbi:MAG: DUF3991 and toprim domain-containing protein [Eubacteriales bacterium]|nr:DUF3991 and toprim domain-containing protein [Eubacteriales bacterium]